MSRPLTNTQARILVTMLGRERRALEILGKPSKGFRPGHRYGNATRTLEKQGMVKQTRSADVYPYSPYFHLTDAGRGAAEILESGDPDHVPAPPTEEG